MDTEEKIAYLGFIQGVVNRLEGNSFATKSWSITLVAALFAISSNSNFLQSGFLALVSIIVFWGLNGYYLRQGRLYRKLYDAVATSQAWSTPYSMNTEPVKSMVVSQLRVFFSGVTAAFHGFLFAATSAFTIYSCWEDKISPLLKSFICNP